MSTRVDTVRSLGRAFLPSRRSRHRTLRAHVHHGAAREAGDARACNTPVVSRGRRGTRTPQTMSRDQGGHGGTRKACVTKLCQR